MLIAVHLAIIGHIVHWFVTGHSLSPVEPSESMATLRNGVINAGFIFFGVAIVATLVLGRFVCGWGCHVVALQDLCAWLMKKIGVQPRPFRSRLLMGVPLLAALYMFGWPLLERFTLGTQPELAGQNAIFIYEFWETFPTWPVAVLTLVVCGFAVVYFLGAKGFCTYGCPYGAIFDLADRFAPGKIVADLDRCEKCGHCTATCTSNVRIHEEIQVHGMVVDSGCMKCLDCVSVCPNDALSYRLRRPRAFSAPVSARSLKRRWDLSWGGEIALAAVFLLGFAVTWKAYAHVPFLLALGFAGCIAHVTWKQWQLFRKREVRLPGLVLRRAGRLRPAGMAHTVAFVLVWILVAHTGIVNGNQWLAWRDAQWIRAHAGPNPSPEQRAANREHAERSRQRYLRTLPFWEGGVGLVPVNYQIQEQLAWLALNLGYDEEALARVERAVRQRARYGKEQEGMAMEYAQLLHRHHDRAGAVAYMEEVHARHPHFARLRWTLAQTLVEEQRPEQAIAIYREWLEQHPDDKTARAKLEQLERLP